MKHKEYFAARNWQMINRVDGEQSFNLHYLKPVRGKLVLCCDSVDLKKLPIKLPAFYEECLKIFCKVLRGK